MPSTITPINATQSVASTKANSPTRPSGDAQLFDYLFALQMGQLAELNAAWSTEPNELSQSDAGTQPADAALPPEFVADLITSTITPVVTNSWLPPAALQQAPSLTTASDAGAGETAEDSEADFERLDASRTLPAALPSSGQEASNDSLQAQSARSGFERYLQQGDPNASEITTAITHAPAQTLAMVTNPLAPAPAAAALPPTATAEVMPRVGSPEFSEAWPRQVAVLVASGTQSAEIRVHPPELGPVEIQIQIDQGEVEIDFLATHWETCQALEVAIPRLKELLAEQGLQLGQTSVGQEQLAKRDETNAGWAQAAREAAVSEEQGEMDGAKPVAFARQAVVRLVDTFA